MTRLRCFALLALFFLTSVARAEVLRVEVDSRVPVLGGRAFGEYGSYEIVRGRIFFGFDPANPMNHRIVDLGLAPRNAGGLVEAWANFVVLQPADPTKARGVALVEVSNRGGMAAPRYFNRAANADLDPDEGRSFGDALLLRQGLTVVWIGWQYDVPVREGILRLHVPRARHVDGTPISGLVRSDWVVDDSTATLPVAHRNHVAYPVAAFDHPANVLTVRDGRDAERRVVPRETWHFARLDDDGRRVPDSTHVTLDGGFVPGKIYELVYVAQDPAVVGLGLAAIRDVISYAKYDDDSLFPVQKGIAFGISQTGRFLRHFIYQGFNTDEQGRQAYDGMLVITAGAGRGSFNHRFAQPSRDAHRYSAFFYPTDLFPFTSRPQLDPKLWRTDGLRSHLLNPEQAPKTFFVNTGYEYWGRAAALVHLSVDGSQDVLPMPDERIYHLASAQHFPWVFPPPARMKLGDDPPFYRGNPLDFSVSYRALLVRLVEWVAEDVLPPPNAYPLLSNGTLVSIGEVRFPDVPGVDPPAVAHTAYRADYGPRWGEGIVSMQPPLLGETYPVRVPQVDVYGNEADGVRNVEVRVPLATYTPWNLRVGAPAATDELTDFYGSFIPLPRTEADKERAGDPRPSIESLYDGKDDYLAHVDEAVQALVDEGFLLEDDRAHVVRQATRLWEWIVDR